MSDCLEERLERAYAKWTPGGWEVPGTLDLSGLGLTELPKIKSVGGLFYCGRNKLKSLRGCPSTIPGSFYCGDNELTTLEHGPDDVGGLYVCADNNLETLKYFPKKVGSVFHCSNNNLETLEGIPASINYQFVCAYNKLTSLKGAPAVVGTSFRCQNNQLTSLAGAPSYIGNTFDCSHNQLTSLQGCPTKVGSFICSFNKLRELDYLPDMIIGAILGTSFDCRYNYLPLDFFSSPKFKKLLAGVPGLVWYEDQREQTLNAVKIPEKKAWSQWLL